MASGLVPLVLRYVHQPLNAESTTRAFSLPFFINSLLSAMVGNHGTGQAQMDEWAAR
jgi:hypothetical protein